jgi:hypothetical protein
MKGFLFRVACFKFTINNNFSILYFVLLPCRSSHRLAASASGHVYVVALLLTKGALVLLQNKQHKTASYDLHCIVLYCIVFYSILFYSILFYSILLYSILFYSILFYSILFYSTILYSHLSSDVSANSAVSRVFAIYNELPLLEFTAAFPELALLDSLNDTGPGMVDENDRLSKIESNVFFFKSLPLYIILFFV